MAKLYDLTEGYRNLLELLDNPEIPQDIVEKALNEVSEDIEEKVENIAKLIKSIEVDTKGIKEEETRLASRRKSLESRVSNLKAYIEASMRAVGKDNIKGKIFTLAFQKNPSSVNVIDLKAIPKKFFIKQEPLLDKKGLLEVLKSGKKVKGAEIKQSEGLRIR